MNAGNLIFPAGKIKFPAFISLHAILEEIPRKVKLKEQSVG